MNTKIKFILYIIATALLSSTTFFFFPVAKEADAELPLAIAFASSITQLGAAWYFISSLKSFKKGLKLAYTLLATGILLFSLVQLIPSLTVFDVVAEHLTSVALGYTLFMVPYALGASLMYTGMRKFAKLLDVRYLWNSFLFVFTLSIAMGGLTVLLLALSPPYEMALIDRVAFGLVIWCGFFSVAAALVAVQIRKAIGPVYKNAMTWLAIALGGLAFNAFHEFVAKMYLVETQYVLMQYSLLAFLLTGVLFLKAGLSFKETSHRSVNLPADASYVDVVVGLAKMVSKPEAIDAALDEVRKITSRLGPQDKLTGADKAVLIDTYARIEHYLVTDEPLHKLTKEELRNSLPDPFLQDLVKREVQARTKS